MAGWHAYDSFPFIACVIGNDGTIHYVNNAWLRFALENGVTDLRRVSSGVNYLNVCRRAVGSGDESAIEALDGIGAILRGETREFALEYPCHSPTEKRWFLVKAALVEEGKYVLILHMENTECRMREQALRETAKRFQVLYEESPAICFIIDSQSAVLSVNRFGAVELGYLPEDLAGTNILLLVPEEDRELARRRIAFCLERPGEVIQWETRKVRKDGSIVWLKEAARAVQQFNDEQVILIVCENISALMQADEALRKSEARLGLAVQKAGMGTWDCDLRANTAFWSENLFRLLGYEPHPNGEATLEMCLGITHPDDIDKVRSDFESARRDHTVYSSEHRIIRPNSGDLVWLSSFGRFFYEADGNAVRFIGILFDSTDCRRMEEEVKNTQTELEKRVRELKEKSEHLEELNTALRVVYKQREEDRRAFEQAITRNVRDLISPILWKLRHSDLNSMQSALVETLQSHLNEIASSFSSRLGSLATNLTRTEIHVAALVKEGKTTAEIANVLGLSEKTIQTHRANIRRKLGLRGTKENLGALLMNLNGKARQ